MSAYKKAEDLGRCPKCGKLDCPCGDDCNCKPKEKDE